MDRQKINMAQLEEQAQIKARNHIIAIFDRPGRLEKLEQLKQNYARKKVASEAKIRSAMQTQLDGVQTGLTYLNASMQVVEDVEVSLKSMNNLLKTLPNFSEKFYDLREESMRHSQYVIAKENLKYIFNVPENIEKTRRLINDGQLLSAHQYLHDLERSRDELFLELHKMPNQSHLDTAMLKAYFADVQGLSESLEKQVKLILSRTLNTVRKDPSIIVTVFRLIEREERNDREWNYQKSTFKAPGRPKRWKDMAFDVIEKTVETRIQGTHVDEREENKLWLVRYLELTRQVILEDLRVVKSVGAPCFPPDYKMVEQFIHWYHKALSQHLEELILNGLEGNEFVTMLSWTLNAYASEELMGHPALKEYTELLGPILSEESMNHLQEQYLKIMENNYTEWMQNTLKTEKGEWLSNKAPQAEKYLRTAAPVIIYQMIDQNLEVAKTINEWLTYKVLTLSLEQVNKYAEIYRDAIIEYKTKHFEDRSRMIYFTQYMITILNNCHQVTELGNQLEKTYCVPSAPTALSDTFKRLHNTYNNLRSESAGYLLEEVFLDLDKHFAELFTQKWLTSTISIDTICATLEDYFQDYQHLVEPNFKKVIREAKNIITKKYLEAMLWKRMSFKTLPECQKTADKILKEVRQIQKAFDGAEDFSDEDDNCLDVIIMLAEVLKCEDDMMSFDLHRIVEKYPDVTEEHLLRLLYLRGDLSKTESKEKVTYAIKNSKPKTLVSKHNIFKQLVFPKLVNLSF